MSEPTADLQQLVKHFSQGQSCIPEPRGAHAAQRRMRPRPAVDCLDALERIRRGLLARGVGARTHPDFAMPMSDEGALSVRALKWGRRIQTNEKGAPACAGAPE